MTTHTTPVHYVHVCPDCYMSFHGVHEDPRGDEMRHLAGLELTDATCPDHNGGHMRGAYDDDRGPAHCTHCGDTSEDNGITTFSRAQCDGCGDDRGGERYRLAVWETFGPDDDAPIPYLLTY